MTASTAAPRILLIGSDHPTTWIVFNRLVREFGLFSAIIEDPVSKRQLVRNRARRLGWRATLSQVAFVTLLRPVLQYQATRRISAICREHAMERQQPFTPAIEHVENINSSEAIALIAAKKPDVVIVNGTRILKKELLDSIKATFINTHQGITPMYRGAHGGYWALYNDDPANCGVTIHLVDEGVDTGHIIAQALISPGAADTYISYPYLQIAAALPLLVMAVRSVAAGTLMTTIRNGPSGLWHHPGVFQYLRARLRGVK